MSSPFLDRELVTEKLNSVLRLIGRLLGDQFPYPDSDEALRKIKDHFSAIQTEIATLDSDTEHSTILKYCTRATLEIELYKRFLGLILRSSNVRNAFEIYKPLREIGERLLGPEIRIIISSEWDFIPFIYPELTPELKEFIFVGLPASESQNALLTPLAGHEFGHAVWRRKAIDQRFARLVSERLVRKFKSDPDLLARYFPDGTKPEEVEKHKDALIWKYCYNFATRQAEEIFCDFIGLWLFGTAFLYSFQYMIAPGGGERSGNYPSPRKRSEYLLNFAATLGHEVDWDFLASFPEVDETTLIAISIAEEIVETLIDDLAAAATSHCRGSGISRPTTAGMDAAYQCFRLVSPASNVKTVADIVNAGWRLRVALSEWPIPGVTDDRKIAILNDLIFKSFEVHEWHLRGATNGP